MLNPLDNYYAHLPEPERACLQYLREHIKKSDPAITEAWKYGMPFFCYPHLLTENRARMKILLLDPSKDLPLKRINALLKKAIAIYK